ncbi:hypothetical protein CN315_26925 [Bacillus cereus]|nr:hypothetical protein CN315_26925 [Bacillus cereus]PFR87180.1 hypothetical protein COK43_23290 [Bacillus cereus]HDR4782775.1 hypothetical protein [Bacillus cereus]HDR4793623.1 hypothetical protein [Bacillus cereus]
MEVIILSFNALEYFKEKDVETIYSEKILGNDIWYFENILSVPKEACSKYYDDIKRRISQELDIHFNNICIVGSAKMGFSYKENSFSEFRCEDVGDVEASDIDIAIICDKKFHLFWNMMLEITRNGGKLGKSFKEYNYITSAVFRKFMITDVIPESHNEYIREWNSKIDSLTKDFQTQFKIIHVVNFRLYESWDGLKNYQIKSLNKVKTKILNGEFNNGN